MPPNKKTKAKKRALRQANSQRKARARHEINLEPSSTKRTNQVVYVCLDKITCFGDARGSIYELGVIVNLDIADREGRWKGSVPRGWDEEAERRLKAFFDELGDVTWEVIYQQQDVHGDRPVEHFCPRAQSRWMELGYEQFDTAFRFRMNGLCRLFGIRYFDVFHLIWYDQAHYVITSNLKNT